RASMLATLRALQPSVVGFITEAVGAASVARRNLLDGDALGVEVAFAESMPLSLDDDESQDAVDAAIVDGIGAILRLGRNDADSTLGMLPDLLRQDDTLSRVRRIVHPPFGETISEAHRIS